MANLTEQTKNALRVSLANPTASANLIDEVNASAKTDEANTFAAGSTFADLTATMAELNRNADTSARIVTTTATALSLTVTEHGERIVLVNTNSTVANTLTLPAATGTGAKFTVINNITQTQGSVVVAAAGTNVMVGTAWVMSSTEEAALCAFTTATDDKVTLNLTTTGGLGGDIIEAWDSSTGVWTVQVRCNGNGAIATPFSPS